MTLRIVAVSLALTLALSYGAVVPQDDDFYFNAMQSFLADPESYASALGMTRVKRSSWDKEFNLNSIGANIKIKYFDPDNQLKGGRAEITIDNLKKYVKRARSSFVKLDVMFNGGDNARDGLFELEVQYELHHNGVEKGMMKAVREIQDGLWVTKVTNENTQMPSGEAIFPTFELNTRSDRKTMLQGTYKCSHGHEYELNVDRQPGKQIDATLTGNGRVYTLQGRLDKEDKKIEVDLDSNGVKYFVVADYDFDGGKMELELSLNLGGAGAYKVELEGNKDLTNAGLQITFNDSDFAKLKVKGKLDRSTKSAKYEVRYSIVGLGDGKLRFSRQKTATGGELKLQYLPKTGLDLKFEGVRTTNDDKSTNMHAVLSRGDEKYLEYNIDLTPKTDGDSFEMNVASQFDVNEKSATYEMFCTYGCFKRRSLKARMYVPISAPYKMDIDVNLYKDDEEVLMVDINTKDNPYVMKIFAPRLLPKILPTGRQSIEFEADHNPGQYLHVKSNTNAISSFNIDRLDGDMRKIELNGHELFKAAFKKGDNSISQTTELPDGRALTTTISWDDDNMKKNKVNLKLDGTERQFNGDFEWDVTDKKDMWLKAHGKGQNDRWGNYEANRDLKCSVMDGVIKMTLEGHAEFEKFPLPTPVDTNMNAMLDTNNLDYAFELEKTFDGKKYGVSMKNGKLSVTM